MSGLKRKAATAGAAAFKLSRHREHIKMRRSAELGDAVSASLAMDLSAADAEASIEAYMDEDQVYEQAVQRVRHEIDLGYPIQDVPRQYLPNFDFSRCVAVVVVGQDGLVANTAKYVDGLPMVAINPDPDRFDGVLLPFKVNQARSALRSVINERAHTRRITLARVDLNDGQHMLAFNDLFIGAASHVSARYTLRVMQSAEPQSSSGVLVSTGAGASGWMSSVYNAAEAFAKQLGLSRSARPAIQWEDRRLLWAVREPFISRHSKAGLVIGSVGENEPIVLESLMPHGGVIFSDGIEQDYLEFNSGTVATIGVAQEQATLVVGSSI
ncbi:MAG: hypothetical protein AAGI37_19850 [Planctomycetota bacterium]